MLLFNYLYGTVCHCTHLATLNNIYFPLYSYFKVPNKIETTSLQDFIQINIGLGLSLQSGFLVWACKPYFQYVLESSPSLRFFCIRMSNSLFLLFACKTCPCVHTFVYKKKRCYFLSSLPGRITKWQSTLFFSSWANCILMRNTPCCVPLTDKHSLVTQEKEQWS